MRGQQPLHDRHGLGARVRGQALRAFSSAGPKGARCRRGRGAPCARLPPTLPLTAAASTLPNPKLSAQRGAASVVLFPTGQVLSPGHGPRPRPPRGPAQGGATGDIRTSLRGPPTGGERPTRVARGENSRHAHRERRLQEAVRRLSVRHASSRVATPPSVLPWRSLWLRPRGSPRSAHAGNGSSAQCCLQERGYFAALSRPCSPT